jgi:hypothetical protein
LLPFTGYTAALSLLQAVLVALPRRRQPFPWMPSSPWWALVPAGSIVLVVAAIELEPAAADLLTWLALFAVPPLAAFALAALIHGSRPLWGAGAAPLLALAIAAQGSLAGEAAAAALSGLACVTLGWLLVAVVPAVWLRVGIYAMAAVDAALIAADVLQGPSGVLSTADPGGLPRLQVVELGTSRMGFGDIFVAATVGCLLARDRRRQLEGAALLAVLGLAFDLLFLTLDTLPATVPPAVALAIVESRRRRAGRLSCSGPRT